jgi:redox-sensing transcriptional repressor
LADRLTVGVAARLSRYLQVLTQARKMGKDRISSQEIAEYTNINATQIRRDLSGFGKFGKRGVGYNDRLAAGRDPQDPTHAGPAQHRSHRRWRLGEAIAGSPIFAEHGITIAAIFDNDDEKLGRSIGHVAVSELADGWDDLPRARTSSLAFSPFRRRAGQAANDAVVRAGVKIVFNYSQALLRRPADVQVHASNPAVELLYALYFHLA